VLAAGGVAGIEPLEGPLEGRGGGLLQAANHKPAAIIALRRSRPVGLRANLKERTMTLLLLEALGALLLLIFIVWWTMFSGRSKGELKQPSQADSQSETNQSERKPPRT
jgi:hypothetical protein